LLGHAKGFDPSSVGIRAEFDEICPERFHRHALLDGIAMRDVDLGRQTGSCRGARLGLPMIATGGGADPGNLGMHPFQPVNKGDPALHFERASRCVVFMLDPKLGAEGFRKERPIVLLYCGVGAIALWTKAAAVSRSDVLNA